MSLREFTDAAGRTWQVWETVPETPQEERAFRQNARLLADAQRRAERPTRPQRPLGGRFSPGREVGWLTFMAGDEKRRLSPIPPRWAEATDSQLAAYLERAEPARLSDAAARVLAQHTTPKRREDRGTP